METPKPTAQTTALLCLQAFLIVGSYGISRSGTESLFLGVLGNEMLPTVWIAVAIAALLVVAVYNHYAARRPLANVFSNAITLCALVLITLLLLLEFAPRGSALETASAFILYVWKDLYIIILIEAFWSYANLIYGLSSARKTYGLFCAMGSIGGIFFNLSVGVFASNIGTLHTLWLTIPLLVGTWAITRNMGRRHPVGPKDAATNNIDVQAGLQTLKKSRYLVWLLFLIVAIQITITLVDYQYNVFLEETYPDQDERTGINGRIYALIDGSAMILQFGAVFVLKYLGLSRVLVLIPALVGAAISALFIAPRFFLAALTKIVAKSLDYSLFRAAKEMLYLPLSYSEKTQGKALIDMLTYRVA